MLSAKVLLKNVEEHVTIGSVQSLDQHLRAMCNGCSLEQKAIMQQ